MLLIKIFRSVREMPRSVREIIYSAHGNLIAYAKCSIAHTQTHTLQQRTRKTRKQRTRNVSQRTQNSQQHERNICSVLTRNVLQHTRHTSSARERQGACAKFPQRTRNPQQHGILVAYAKDTQVAYAKPNVRKLFGSVREMIYSSHFDLVAYAKDA